MRLEEIEVGTSELADTFGVSARQIQNLAERGYAKRVGRGRYLLHESIRLYVAHLHEAADERGGEAGVSELARERARLAAAQADGMALKNAAMREAMVSAAEVETVWSASMRTLSANMLAIPSRVSRKLSHLTEHEVEALEAEIRLALAGLTTDGQVPPTGQ